MTISVVRIRRCLQLGEQWRNGRLERFDGLGGLLKVRGNERLAGCHRALQDVWIALPH